MGNAGRRQGTITNCGKGPERGIRSGSGPPNSYTLHTLGNQCEPLVRPLLSGYQISPFTLPPQTGKRKASRGAGDGEISERISNM